MLGFLRRRRRTQLLEAPFPEAWRQILESRVGSVRYLSADERSRLEDLVQVFVHEKNFEGCGGLTLSDEIRVTIAGNAGLLLLGLDHDLYARVESILVYPSAVRPPARERSPLDTSLAVSEPRPALLGEAHLRGPVILTWDAVRHDSRHPRCGHNVVFHEFAHKLDMLDDEIDGTPPLRGSAAYARWSRVCGAVYFDLQARTRQGLPSFLDPYAAVSEAEFFAVATEVFFERPHALRREHADLYDVLREFYQQDPSQRMPDSGGRAPEC